MTTKVEGCAMMFDLFETYLRASLPFSSDEIARVKSLAVFKHLKKKQYLLQAGDVCRYYTFVSAGCLRSYRIGSDGAEHIMGFSPAGHWISDEISLANSSPSSEYIDALEDSDIVQLSVENFKSLVRDIPNFSVLYTKITTIEATIIGTGYT